MDKINAVTSIPAFGSIEYKNYFRNDYIEKDGKSEFLGITNPYFYMAIIFCILISLPVYLVCQITEFKFYYLILLPIFFLICNLTEYILHRYPMHHKIMGMAPLYKHLTVHHSFFNEDSYYFEQPRDYMAAFLPLLYFSIISAIIFLISLFIFLVSDFNNALLFGAFSYVYYLMYESLHFSYHTPSNSFIKKIPFIEQFSRMHLLHHRASLMNKYNFNITFPIFDKLFNTFYKDK